MFVQKAHQENKSSSSYIDIFEYRSRYIYFLNKPQNRRMKLNMLTGSEELWNVYVSGRTNITWDKSREDLACLSQMGIRIGGDAVFFEGSLFLTLLCL